MGTPDSEGPPETPGVEVATLDEADRMPSFATQAASGHPGARAHPPHDDFVEVLGFDVPRSHRARWGPVITAAKRWGTRGLSPLQRWVLDRQLRFDLRLRALLRQPEPTLPELAREELTRLADPRPVGAVGRWLPSVPGLEAQRSWNLAVVALLSRAGWPLRTDGAAEALDALEARCDVLSQEAGVVGLPLWRELWRRQVAFNHATVRLLRHLLDAARPAVLFPSPETYTREALAQEDREVRAATAALARLERQPRISLITPAWETPVDVLRACIASVRAQVYPHWELCIVDDGSRSAAVAEALREAAAGDARIRFERLESNQGIARATNAALALATGEYVGFLDHDDLLAPHALAEVALRLGDAPDADVVYSDEDKVDARGLRFAPYLKPALSPELLRAVNYVCHFLVVRASLLREVGGIRTGFEGAQDHDLLLRLMERTQRFEHIPRVLYHWRTLPGSTATDASAKPAASEAGRRAVAEHLARMGEGGSAETVAPGLYRIRHPLVGRPRVSVLLSEAPTGSELAALLAFTDDLDVEVRIPVASPVASSTRDVIHVQVDADATPGAVANRLLREARGELILVLEAGTLPTGPGWLRELASQALRRDVGVVGARIVSPAGQVLEAGLRFDAEGRVLRPFAGMLDPTLGAFGGSHWPRDVRAVSSACAMIRREVLESLGGWDAAFMSDEARGVDLCLRAGEAGLRILYAPHARLVRTRSRKGAHAAARDADRLRETWARAGRTDPSGHPRLDFVQTP
ncbi:MULTISPECIES: glycosyltransferase family 2 protein [unclassified Corallococcus]|uniref:glycosyltransferase family 2 protein n=1 Tax=unclassified Corallococcus TaxID=2685029 RepID=UPI001A902EE9|nr:MULTISPECIES: glycosyltransferase [unclassified Corallococcus]MBN9684525.1 glycosyltransferase [Corallococcus sp. NCSPR001]WAS84001.1 glycosyltransferase [Corallococcus sp. NCRR]